MKTNLALSVRTGARHRDAEQHAALQYRRTRPAGKLWLCARIVTCHISKIRPSQSSLDDAAASWSE